MDSETGSLLQHYEESSLARRGVWTVVLVCFLTVGETTDFSKEVGDRSRLLWKVGIRGSMTYGPAE